MLKNKFKTIIILTLIILSLSLPIVRAEDEIINPIDSTPEVTTENNEPVPINATDDPANNTTAITEENFKKSDIFLTGDNVVIDYIVDGNLFVFANNVTINSQIGGDAFICASNVTIGEQGYIFSNLFTFSKNVTINGVVYDLYSASQNITINGYIYRDIHVGSNNMNIFGTIGRNAFVNSNTYNFVKTDDSNNEKRASITGNLHYTAPSELSIPEGIVTGETKFEPSNLFKENNLQNQLIRLITFLITVITIWLLCLWIAPKFLKNNHSLLTTKKVLPVIGFGILTPIILVLLSCIFLLLGVTYPLALLTFLIFFAFIAISNSMFIITLNNIICKKLKIEKKIGIFGMLVATTVVLWLIGLIPIIGFITGSIVLILGLGITVSSIVQKEKTDTK
ncbi:MAG: hypothetical protein HFJ33_03415 [Clostridia bacterium]|nr:hypothetical protein [Clostridia bacterium]